LWKEFETDETVLRITIRYKGMSMWLESVLDLIIMIVACEALVELIKKAAPLQSVKEWLVRHTPFLYSESQQTHLLQCPWCISVWVGALIALAYFYVDYSVFMIFCLSMTIHRMSNYIHVFFSLMADRQRDIRVARRK